MNIYFVGAELEEEEFFAGNLPEHQVLCVSTLGELPAEAQIISIFINERIDAAFLDAHPQLRAVATRSHSMDHIDQDECARRGIAIGNVETYGESTVAEHTFALILALVRRLREMLALKRRGQFSYAATRGTELRGKTLGILGMGRIGLQVAALAKAFRMRVIAHDIEASPDLAHTLGFEFVELPALLGESDILSLHASLSAATYQIINAETLARCRPGILIINTARGALIDTAALRDALVSGHVGGAGLDVLQDERVLRDSPAHIIGADIVKHLRSDSEAYEARDSERVRQLQELMLADSLLSMRNVIFTPHVAFNTVEAITQMRRVTLENVRSFARAAG